MIPHRIARELVFQLHRAGEHERLAETLSSIPIFLTLFSGETYYEVLRYWASLGEQHDLQGAYHRGLDQWRLAARSDEICAVLGEVATLLQEVGNTEGALEMQSERLALAGDLGDRCEQAKAQAERGSLLLYLGELARSIEASSSAKILFEEVGDRHGQLYAIGIIGDVYYYRGELDQALACFQQADMISRELGDRRSLSRNLNSVGLAQLAQGKYNQALACFDEAETVSRALGDRIGLSYLLGSMGILFAFRGDFERALCCYSEQESICDELGNPRGLANAIGYSGVVHDERGDFNKALESYARAATEHRAIKFRIGLVTWLQGTAGVLLALAAAGEEMPEYLPAYVPGAAPGRWHALSLRAARVAAEECVAIAVETSIPEDYFYSRLLLARLDAAEGRRDVALQRLQDMLQEAIDDEQRAELHYWLWKISSRESSVESPESKEGDESGGHRAKASCLYEELLAKTPKHGYRKRIDELTAGGIA